LAVERRVIIPLIVACALFMQNLDSTALATALPAIAESLHETPLRLHLVITSFMLSLAAFLPVSGWVADRFGARTIFRLAIVIFTLASVACGLTDSFEMLLLARVVQGAGGALMVPVGRLILVRSVAKSELIQAMALMGMPALIGPIIGPLLAFFRALNHDRAILRIEKRDTQFGAGQILLGHNFSLEGVPGIDNHPIARLDHHHRLGVRADGVVEYSLALFA
jgi:MFS family permease